MIRCPHCTHFMSTGEAERGACLDCIPIDWDAVLRDWAGPA